MKKTTAKAKGNGAAGGPLFGDLELNFSDDKSLMIDAEGDGPGRVQIGLDTGNVGLRICLSKKQASELRAKL